MTLYLLNKIKTAYNRSETMKSILYNITLNISIDLEM